jgi:hypothetical protein
VFDDWALSRHARALLARERVLSESESLKASVIARARAFVDGDRPSGVELRRATPAIAAATRRSRRLLPPMAAVIVVASLATAGIAIYAFKDSDNASRMLSIGPGPRSSPEAAPGVTQSAPPARTQPEPDAPPPPAKELAASPGSDASRAPAARQYESEVLLLEPAGTSIAQGDYAAALRAVARHRHEFPNGQLAQEREALGVRALWGLGRQDAALAAADAFRKRFPRSALLGWMKDQAETTP